MLVPRITKEELKARLDAPDPSSHPTILDARLKYPYEHSTVRLPGAIRVAPGTLDQVQFPRDRDIVAYDSDPDEITSRELALKLLGQGCRVSVLKGGIAEWMSANLPVEAKAAVAAPKPAAADVPKPAAAKG